MLKAVLHLDPEEDDGKEGNPPTGDSDDGRDYHS